MAIEPNISVVLPTHNGAMFLAESIRSILGQTGTDLELIIVDDASSDETATIVRSFAEADPRVRVITNAVNLKLPASLNLGFAAARGKYLTWTSDDNAYKPGALVGMATYLDLHPETDMVSFNFDLVDVDGRFIREWVSKFAGGRRILRQLAFCNNVGAAFMYRRTAAERAGGYDPGLFCAEDYDYWCRLALHGKVGYVDGQSVYRYRVHGASLSATKRALVQERTLAVIAKYGPSLLRQAGASPASVALVKFALGAIRLVPGHGRICFTLRRLVTFLNRLVNRMGRRGAVGGSAVGTPREAQ